MAETVPLKYENKKHEPFYDGEVLLPNVLGLANVILPGDNILITPLPGGRIRIDNTCCVDPCVPDWQPTGQTVCADGTTRNEEADGCGNTRWIDTGVACGGCTPNWQDTGVTRCTGGNVENQQLDGCGNSRWFDTGTPVAWTNNGATVCGGGGTLLQPQINQCGNTRLHDTGVACVDPCTPTWVDTGTTRCTGANVESYQEDGCGNTRWFDTGTPVVWTDNGGRQCAGGFYQRNETNQCGATRWANIEAIAWTNTGSTRCTGANVEAEQINQCGTVQWVSTGVPVSWGDTGNYDCTGANLLAQQINQCGGLRWDDRGAMPWTNTGNQRCTGTNREVEQSNPCGGLRWVDTGVPVWTDVVPSVIRCTGANIEKQQVNACDASTRWFDTGTPVTWTDDGEPYCEDLSLKQPQVNQCGEERVIDTEIPCGGPLDCNCFTRHTALGGFVNPYSVTTYYGSFAEAEAAYIALGSPPAAQVVQDAEGPCWWIISDSPIYFDSCDPL